MDPCSACLTGSIEDLDWRYPRLRDLGLPNMEHARMLPTLVVSQTFLGLVKKGERLQERAEVVATRTLEMLNADKSDCPFMMGALAETKDCARFLQILAGKGDFTTGELDVVMVSKNSTRYLMKQATLQNKFYKDLEQTLRKQALAGKVMMPKVKEAEESLSASLENLETTVNELPKWKDALRKDAWF